MQWAILIGAFASALALGPILLQLNRSGTVYVPAATAAPGLSLPLPASPVMETLHGRQAREDGNRYAAVYKTDPAGGPTGKYLLDPATGRVVYFVDPGFNGTVTERPDGTKVQKFNPPKATLVSYIIKGILDRNLPWALVLLGVMIAVTLELCGIPSLVFAVGVYLPLSSSAPLFVGGAVRWLADRHWRRRPEFVALGSEQFAAESDKSPGVLLSSGLIAGGAIAGIVVAFLAGLWSDADTYLDHLSKAHNPFFEGPHADALSMLPFAVMVVFLWLVAREQVLSTRRR